MFISQKQNFSGDLNPSSIVYFRCKMFYMGIIYGRSDLCTWEKFYKRSTIHYFDAFKIINGFI